MTNKLDLLCRTCLEQLNEDVLDTNKYNVFDIPNLKNKLCTITSMELLSSDEFPKNLCHKCYKKVLEYYEFREMCFSTMERIKRMQREEEEKCCMDDDDKPLMNFVLESKLEGKTELKNKSRISLGREESSIDFYEEEFNNCSSEGETDEKEQKKCNLKV